MILSLKELIVVLIIAWAVFRFAKPIALLFSTEGDFSRRRNVWCVLTVAVFLSPNFWVFMLVAAPVLIFIGRRDSNPSAIYLLLLHIVPSISRRVPMVGLSYLMDLNFGLLLSFCVMTPAALSYFKAKDGKRNRGLEVMDFFLLAYCVLSAVLYVHPEVVPGVVFASTFTDCLRRGFESFFAIYIPYFVISRSSSSRRELLDILATFCLSCALLAAIAIFEGAWHWLLFGELRSRWGFDYRSYLARGGSLRAMASVEHPLSLGYLLAVAFGIWLYLKSHVKSMFTRITVTMVYWFGLLAAYSRGPWIGAVVIYFVFAALSPGAVSKLFKAAGISAVFAVIVVLSPLGDKIMKVLPFFGGTVDTFNIDYRQRLLDRSWQIIQGSPFFGDQNALLKMEDLRQGDGIIDLMNGFVNVLLNDGFVGLSLFLSFIVIGVFKARKLNKATAKVDPDCSMLGASLVSCILGTLLMIWGGGLIDLMTCVLVGLAAAYVHLGQQQARPIHVRSSGAA